MLGFMDCRQERLSVHYVLLLESNPADAAAKTDLDVIHHANASTPCGTHLARYFSTASKSLYFPSSFSLLTAKKSQLTFKLLHYHGNQFPPDLAQLIPSHVRSSLRCLYDMPGMKWTDSENLSKLTHLCHHIITASSPTILCASLVCFRFDTSDDEDEDEDDDDDDDNYNNNSNEKNDVDDDVDQRPVTYAYEVFTRPDVRGLGVALSLMNLIESVSCFFLIPTVMFSVFKSNTAPLRMHKSFK